MSLPWQKIALPLLGTFNEELVVRKYYNDTSPYIFWNIDISRVPTVVRNEKIVDILKKKVLYNIIALVGF